MESIFGASDNDPIRAMYERLADRLLVDAGIKSTDQLDPNVNSVGQIHMSIVFESAYELLVSSLETRLHWPVLCLLAEVNAETVAQYQGTIDRILTGDDQIAKSRMEHYTVSRHANAYRQMVVLAVISLIVIAVRRLEQQSYAPAQVSAA